MDKTRGEAFKLPAEWVERIFLRLSEIYGSKFENQFTKPEYVELEKYRWRGGLAGLNAAEIKNALNICLNHLNQPPNVVEFYKYAKEYTPAPLKRPEPVKCSPEKQAHYMQAIREKLNNAGKGNGKGNDPLPAERQSILDEAPANEVVPAWLQ